MLTSLSRNFSKLSDISYTGSDESKYDPQIRSSRTFFLNSPEHLEDSVVNCIFARASEFQGFLPHEYFEPVQLVRYQIGEHFGLHHDALQTAAKEGNRHSSFFVILKSEGVEGVGTHFPLVKPFSPRSKSQEDELCRIIRCEDGTISTDADGVRIMAVEGSASFWLNLGNDGNPIKEVLHAGEQLKTGMKYGMNIWSWTEPQA